MSAQSSGPQSQTPTSSASSSASHTEAGAVNFGSSRNGVDPGAFEDSEFLHSVNEHTQHHPATTADGPQEERRQKQHRPRSSGGFLLPNASTIKDLVFSKKELQLSESAKGKRRAEEGDLIVAKQGNRSRRHRTKPSLGSSPLATEILSDQPAGRQNEGDGIDSRKRSSILSTTSQSAWSTDSSNRPATEARQNAGSHGNDRRSNALGYNTDPAQIVNLALHLSESRRRHFSGGSLLVPRDTVGSRRVISSGQPALGMPYSTSGGSLRQHLQQQRRVSRDMSPRSSTSSKEAASSSQRQEQRRSWTPSQIQDRDSGLGQDVMFVASDATLARVEKAKESFELLYEYRRLLQVLPPIPAVSKIRASNGHGADKMPSHTSQALGRAYNPLQYVRNRKVRLRQRRPLDAEADGWKNINMVRKWVDTVKEDREAGIARIDDPFPLPRFDTIPADSIMIDGLQAPAAAQSKRSSNSRPGRPAMDWIIAPWDLLADAQWLDQDNNIESIEDHNYQKIVSTPYSPRSNPPRKCIESLRKGRQSTSLTRRNGSPSRSEPLTARNDSKERGRQRRGFHMPRTSMDGDYGSRERKDRWPKRFIRSRNPSTSDESDFDKDIHGKRNGNRHRGRDQLDHAALEKHMTNLLAKEAETDEEVLKKSNGNTDHRAIAEEDQGNRAGSEAAWQEHAPHRAQALQRLNTDYPSQGKHEIQARASLDERRLKHRRMSSDDFDSTVPNSPSELKHVPSIAINLSPPTSPPMSATSPKKSFPSRLGAFTRSRSRSVDRRAASVNDLGTDSKPTAQGSQQEALDTPFKDRLHKQNTSDSVNGFLSPTKSTNRSVKSGAFDRASVKSIKHTGGSESKLRGLFRGGRIAELVGNEVSRVGDILWKKDSSSNDSRLETPASSHVSEDSDIEDGDISNLDSSPNDNLSRVTTNADGVTKAMPSALTPDKPKYHISNLPSFRPQLDRDQSPRAVQHHDHITRQQLAQKKRVRSSRFDRLAPPKIDMRSVSPSPSSTASRAASRSPESRDSSGTRSNSRVRQADRNLNDMLGIPGQAGNVTKKPSPTGLSAYEARKPGSEERPTLAGHRHWSISDRDVSTVRGTMTKRDVARVRALLLSSGIKANEISRRAEEIPSKPPALLQSLREIFPGPVPLVPKSQEHVIAARTLLASIDSTNRQIKDAMDHFSHVTVEDLHTKIRAIDDRITYTLTPLVRNSADDADTLSTALTTTHTLAIKQLNHSVDIILRRRRRRFRWIRRAGWAMLEWTLLGIMWLAWLIVVIVRLVRGTIRALVVAVRWLFWV